MYTRKSKTSNGILKITEDVENPDYDDTKKISEDNPEIIEKITSFNLDDPSDIRKYIRELANFDASYSTGNDKGKSILDYLLAKAENIKGYVESKTNDPEVVENIAGIKNALIELDNIENINTLTNSMGSRMVPKRNRRSLENKAYSEAKSIIEKQLETVTQEELETAIKIRSNDAQKEGNNELVKELAKKLLLIRSVTGINLDGKLYKKDK